MNEHSQVLQVCVDIVKLQQYIGVTQTANPQLFILNHPVVFDVNTVVSKFGQAAVFYSRDDIRILNPDTILSFDTLQVGENEAKVSFQITHHRLTENPATVNVQIDLAKSTGMWETNYVTFNVLSL